MTKLSPHASATLKRLARTIQGREAIIEKLKGVFVNSGAQLLAEVMLQGKDLLETKKLLPHGEWQSWLKGHFPKSKRTAQIYMRIASNTQHAAHLESTGTIRQTLLLLDPESRPAGDESTPRSWPPYIEAISRISKCTGYIQRFPLSAWPVEGVQELKEKLEPVARELWPEKF